MKREKQIFKPLTPDFVADKFNNLRQPNPARDSNYSPLFDSLMTAVSDQLKEHAPESFDRVWTSSLFPERISQNALRLFEEYLDINENNR